MNGTITSARNIPQLMNGTITPARNIPQLMNGTITPARDIPQLMNGTITLARNIPRLMNGTITPARNIPQLMNRQGRVKNRCPPGHAVEPPLSRICNSARNISGFAIRKSIPESKYDRRVSASTRSWSEDCE
jgi:hypothetical protein